MMRSALFLALALTSVAVGCASNSGDGGSGSGTGAAGGAGGEGGTGGMDPGPCGTDCSLVQAPPCFEAVCNTGQLPGPVGTCIVTESPLGTPCDDGEFCTVNDQCAEGMCIGGPQNTCDVDPDPCENVACDEASQTCSTVPKDDGAPCVSDDLCIVNASCQLGVCVGSQKDCFFAPAPECHVSVCNSASGQCEPTPGKQGEPCDDADPCTLGTTCDAGTCLGGTPTCAGLNSGCVNGVCDPVTGACSSVTVGVGETCLEAADQCNTGVCQSDGSCLSTVANQGQACSDGNGCTSGETCQSGSCGGGTLSADLYLQEDFSDNALGWTLGTEWEIGPAVAGPAGSCADPGADHTPSGDNGVAGVEIGGCSPSSVSNTQHTYYYLESPVVNTSAAAGAVILQYWRVLHSDYTPYMDNVVEVYDGAQWVVVWQSGSTSIHDDEWTFMSHDVTQYKGAQMRVRFGFNIASTGVFDEGSWSLDDVTIASAICN